MIKEEPDILPESPYKFLDYYQFEDSEIFFGRKAETRILLSDVVVARLVVLFAKTGTGKTSIINAGVRPLLEERGYATFFIRVKKDPVDSARSEILKPEHRERWKKELRWEGETFAEQLENIAGQLGMPIVLFFDQFEEFFIYPLDEEPTSKEEQLARRREFVSNIAAIYYGSKSRVHIVFSMREEWFVEMDIFRDEIPKIFHNDSNLRLRWFDQEQARDAIKLPADEFGVTIEDEVVDRLIADIAVNGEIEPAQLQIICDTLWQETKGERITLDDYLSLGDRSSTEKIAKQVLFKRLEKEFKKIQDEDQLWLLYALLPKLQTPRKTKYVRDIPGLIKELTNDDPALREIVKDDAERQDLIERLQRNDLMLREITTDNTNSSDPAKEPKRKEQPLTGLVKKLEKEIGLIRTGIRDNLTVIELSHDYLVESLSDLQVRVKVIGSRQLLEEAMNRYESNGDLISTEALEKISENARILNIDANQAEALFISALAYGAHTMKLWFDRVPEERAWKILEEKIADINEAEYVIDLLGELETDKAYKLLERTLSQDSIASYTIGVLGRKETPQVVEFLAKALKYEGLAAKAEESLARIGRSKRRLLVAEEAQAVLERAWKEQEKQTDEETRAVRKNVSSSDADRHTSNYDPQQSQEDKPPAYMTDSELGPHFKAVSKAFAEGRVIPFLGAGVNSLNRDGREAWKPGQKFLPSGYEFAQYLAWRFGYPGGEDSYSYNVARISQYISVTHGPGALYDEIRTIFDRDYEPTMLHGFLARLPNNFGTENGVSRTPLIITTNYDDVMEQAFLQASIPFEVVSYIAEGHGKGNFMHRPSHGEPRVIYNPNEYRLPERCTVILKLSGSVDRSSAGRDSFVITEDDYIDQFTLVDIYGSIPVAIRARLQRSHILFLGYSLRDWNVRVILQRIWGDQRRVYKSWAIQWNPDPIEQELWAARGVEVHNVHLANYITALKEHMHT